MKMPNWKTCEETLFAETCKAIDLFSSTHPKEEVCFVAYRSDYGNGVNVLSIDTPSNALAKSQDHQVWVLEEQRQLFGRSRPPSEAKYYISDQGMRIFDYTPSTQNFAFNHVCEINFPEWETVLRSEGFDQYDEFQDRVVVLFWRTVDRLVRRKALKSLNMASPFRIGVEFVDDTMGIAVLRLIV